MFGFIFGTICLVALIAFIRRRRHWRRHSYHGGGWGRGWAASQLADQLELNPDQRRDLFRSVQDLEQTAIDLRNEVLASRSTLSSALQSDTFEAEALHPSFAKQDAALAKLRESLVEKARTLHASLDAKQRRTLADIIEFGPRYLGGGHGCHSRRGGFKSATA